MSATSDRLAACAAVLTILLAGSTFLAGGCHDGSDGTPGQPGPPGPPPPPGDTTAPTGLQRGEEPPGIVADIALVAGATGDDGTFQVGDPISVTFTLERADGSTWALGEMAHARALVSGPTFNYQRVLPERDDVAELAISNPDGSFTYAFSDPIPALYAPPYNDSPAFGTGDGELAGQPLLAGTYTVGLSFVWSYTVDGRPFVQSGEAAADFLLGGATNLAPREVVGQASCERCHVALQSHHGERGLIVQCMMCHTAGAEDPNDPEIAGGTPGVTIHSKVLFHRIHNASHLPSVLGFTTDATGQRDYDADPVPFVVVDGAGAPRDYSFVGFPAWPNRTMPMLRDFMYSSLPPEARAKEDAMRTGVTSCFLCHGDPDGAGPIDAPAQGDLHLAQPTRGACGACHDDVVWEHPYTSNAQTMDPQSTDSDCKTCHEVDGGPLAVQDAHLHPLRDPGLSSGLRFELLALEEAGVHDGDGSIDVGERIEVRFLVTDDAGNEIDGSALDGARAVVSGPMENAQLLLSADVPTAILAGPQPYVMNLPQRRLLEFLGDASAAPGEVFTTAVAPHLDVSGARTVVRVRSGLGAGASVLAASAAASQNFIDVAGASGFERDDFIVLDDGASGREEYLQIQLVDGNRLWFSSPRTPAYAPGLRTAHGAGAPVAEVLLATLTPDVDYDLDPIQGAITELSEFGAGNAVLADYTSDFVLPAVHGPALNDSPALDESWGGWRGKSIVPGTYRAGIWGWTDVVVNFALETNEYRAASPAAWREFRLEGAAQVEPYALIASGESCLQCHQQILFHGGSDRDFDACLACHGTGGAQDLPRYVAAAAPETPDVTVSFRTLLHRIHMGARLDAPAAFQVVGAGSGGYPDNFELNTYEDILFPAMPGAAAECRKCHGEANDAWLAPSARDHPSEQILPVRSWALVCGACHDAADQTAHIEANTSPSGVESCGICHAPGQQWNVELHHTTY